MRHALELGRQLAILLLDVELLDRLGQQRLEAIELVGRQRLLDIVVCALAHRVDGRFDRAGAGDDDAFRREILLLHFLEETQPVELWHLQVGEDDAIPLGAELLERFLAVIGHVDLVALVGKYGAQAGRDRRLVVSDQDLCRVLLHASSVG
jgi:hypothetical protein